MKIELIQKKGKHFTWREVLKDNEKEKNIYDRNNPVGHYIYLPDCINLMWVGFDTAGKLCQFVEKSLKKESFRPFSKVTSIHARQVVYEVVDNNAWFVDGDTIVDLNETPRGTKEFEKKLAALYKKALMIRFIFNDDGITLKDIVYEFNCKLHNMYKKSYITISVFNKTEGINNDPFTIGGVEFERVSFKLGGKVYNALYGEGRVKASDIPKGLYKYEVRGDDEDPGRPCTLEDMVSINFVATIFTFDQIKFEDGMGHAMIADSLNFSPEWANEIN